MNKRSDDFQRLGDIPALKQLQARVEKALRPPTRAQMDLVNASIAISEKPDAAELAFMARQLVLCTLPHSDPGNVEAWTRRTGNGSLIIQRGWDDQKEKPIGYPFGSIPRLLLFWITTEVQHTKNRDDMTVDQKRTLFLGRSLNEFMRAVGLNPTTGGGKRGDSKRLHEQMNRLFASHISFRETLEQDGLHGRRWLDMKVAPKGEFWWDPKTPEQGSLFNSWIKLGEDFYEALIYLPVPVDMRALRALKRSPLALDLYAWACFMSFVIIRKSLPPQSCSWTQLSRQLGGDYGDIDNFKKKAIKALKKVKIVYPGLAITYGQKGGFKIHASRLAISQKGGKP